MKNYTILPNEMLNQSQLTIPARYLYCVLLRHCGKDDTCYPGQDNLAKSLGVSARHIRTLLDELINNGLIQKARTGFNKANHYTVAKYLTTYRNGSSYHIGNEFPFNKGTEVPTNITYRKGKGNKGMESLRDYMTKKGLLR